MSNDKLMKREETHPARAEQSRAEQPRTEEPRYRTISPACDVYEDGKEFLVVAEMPGVDERSVDLQLDRTRLTIEAVRGQEDGERIHTRYLRAFEVPDMIDAASISASLKNGVLSVHLPKAPQARVRNISVTAG